jgi:hypothetical protein
VAAYRLSRTDGLEPAEALRECLDSYRPPVPPEVIVEQMRLAAAEATDSSFVPAEVSAIL